MKIWEFQVDVFASIVLGQLTGNSDGTLPISVERYLFVVVVMVVVDGKSCSSVLVVKIKMKIWFTRKKKKTVYI